MRTVTIASLASCVACRLACVHMLAFEAPFGVRVAFGSGSGSRLSATWVACGIGLCVFVFGCSQPGGIQTLGGRSGETLISSQIQRCTVLLVILR